MGLFLSRLTREYDCILHTLKNVSDVSADIGILKLGSGNQSDCLLENLFAR